MQTGFLSRSAHASFQQVSIRRKQVSQDGTQVAKEATRQKQQKTGIVNTPIRIMEHFNYHSDDVWLRVTDSSQSTVALQLFLTGKKAALKIMLFFFFFFLKEMPPTVIMAPETTEGIMWCACVQVPRKDRTAFNWRQVGLHSNPDGFGPLGRPIAKSLGTLGISWGDYGGKELYSFSGVRTKDKVTYVCGPETRERGDEWVDMKSVCWQC